MAAQSSGEIDWKSYEKQVDPEVLKMFKDSYSCKHTCRRHCMRNAACECRC